MAVHDIEKSGSNQLMAIILVNAVRAMQRHAPHLVLLGLACLFLATSTLNALAASWDLNGTTWRPLRIGAGGWLTGLDIASDGTKVVRTDTYGAYIWNGSTSQWDQLVKTTSMPEGAIVDFGEGVYEIRIAQSDSSRLYMMYRGSVYRSDNHGTTWTKTTFARVSGCDPNDDHRTNGPKMAVDPANPDVVYVGTARDGVFVTADGGASWRSVTDVPRSKIGSKGLHPGHAGIAFDPNSGRSSDGKTKTIFISSYGNGVYRSTNAGGTFSALTGGPKNVSHAKVAKDGIYYVAGDDGSKVWKYQAGSWTDITPVSEAWTTVVTDPFDPARVVAIRAGGYLDISQDRGATWSGIIWGPEGRNGRVAKDIPWLAWSKEDFMSEGDLMFDPTTPNRLWFAEGIGFWHADIRGTPEAVVFTSQSAGIEQLVANWVIHPPGGRPVVASWDRPVFFVSNPDAFPATHGPDNAQALLMGWSVDYATTDPSFIVALMNWGGVEKSGYSRDGGRTWEPFAAQPPLSPAGKFGGSIASSTPTNFVWVPNNNGNPYYTKDGGATWIPVAIPGIPSTRETGWGWAYYLNRHIAAADRVSSGVFYIYNYGPTDSEAAAGIYRSTDGGATWTHVHRGAFAFSGFHAKLRAVPGKAGHLFLDRK